jgi:hypothetical protein
MPEPPSARDALAVFAVIYRKFTANGRLSPAESWISMTQLAKEGEQFPVLPFIAIKLIQIVDIMRKYAFVWSICCLFS